MANQKSTTKRTISSLVVPTAQDLAVWQSMTDAERQAVLLAKADEAIASPHRIMTADELIAESKAELADG